MARPQRYTDGQFAAVLIECKGMTFVASRRLGCDHSTMIRRIAKSARLQAVIAEQTGQMLDTAELKLAQAVTNGDLGAIKYLLSTKGRGRGYGERVELTGAEGAPILVRQITAVPPGEADDGRADPA